jgi:hypothetical protein
MRRSKLSSFVYMVDRRSGPYLLTGLAAVIAAASTALVIAPPKVAVANPAMATATVLKVVDGDTVDIPGRCERPTSTRSRGWVGLGVGTELATPLHVNATWR